MHANLIMHARLSVRLLALVSMLFIASCKKEEDNVTPTGGNAATASISALNCEGVLNTGTLTAGVAASGVSSSVPYTGGNGVSYGTQSVGSTGVTGLTATLAAGTLASGTGSLSFVITGTPSNSGTASFELSLGGQSCTLSRMVAGTTTTGTTLHTCGTPNVHNPNLTYGSMTDQQGNVYKTIVIGTQEWMAENLNTSIYRNGDAIPTGLSDAEWENTDNTQQGAWAYSNNDASYACPYGKHYNWYACVDARQLCPIGWHVPTDAEWTVLIDYLGGVYVAGGKMKSIGIVEAESGLWNWPNDGATNSIGFSGVPEGGRSLFGDYGTIGFRGCWWSTSEFTDFGTESFAWYRFLDFDSEYAFRYNDYKQNGFSVRCLRD